MEFSVCIIAKNEEKNIEKCLKNLCKYGFEIIVVDTGSSDATKEIAKHYTEHVYDFAWCNDFSKARNYAVSQASHEMIITIDCDEFLGDIQMEEFVQCVAGNEEKVGRILLRNRISRNDEEMEQVEWVSRIFSKKKFTYEGKIHEQLVSKDGSVYETYDSSMEMTHGGYFLTGEQRKAKAARNIEMLSKEMAEKGKDSYLLYQMGKSFYLAQDYENACECFAEALSFDLNPRLEYVIDAVDSYGYALLNAGRAKEALSFTNIEAEFGQTSDFQFLLGLIYMNNELFEQAVMAFEKAVTLGHGKVTGVDSFLAYYNMGVIYECLGYKENALAVYNKCGEYGPAQKRVQIIANNE